MAKSTYKGYRVERDGSGIIVLLLRVGSNERPLLISNDDTLIKKRIKEIEEDVARGTSRKEVILMMYRWVKQHGAITLMKPVLDTSKGIFKIVPDNGNAMLLLARGKQEVILAKGTRGEMKDKYIALNEKSSKNPELIKTMWEYALTKQRLELRDAQ